MEEETIKVIVKECDSKREDFPKVETIEGKKLIETIKIEADLKNKKTDD